MLGSVCRILSRVLVLLVVVFLTTGCDVVVKVFLGSDRGSVGGPGSGSPSEPLHPSLKATLSTMAGSVATGSGDVSTRYTNSSNPIQVTLSFKTEQGASVVVAVDESGATRALQASDLVLSNGTIANFAVVGGTSESSSYTFEVTPVAEGAVTMRLPAGLVRGTKETAPERQSLRNEASNLLTVVLDLIAPTVTISGPNVNLIEGDGDGGGGSVGKEFEWEFDYTDVDTITLAPEDTSVITTGDVVCPAPVISPGSDENSRKVTVGPCTGDGTVRIELNPGSGSDHAGNISVGDNTQPVLPVDNTPPTIAIASPSPTAGNNTTDFEWDVTYSGADTISLVAGNVSLVASPLGSVTCASGPTVGAGGDANSRTVTVGSCTGNGTLKIELAAGTAEDNAGNETAAHTTASTVTVDNTAPTVTIASPSPTAGNNTTDFEWEVSYSGASTIGLVAGNVSLVASPLGSVTCASGPTVGAGGDANSRTVTVGSCTG
ncbi:MAG: hypothetical protein RBT63_07975, partial [Bdellovibrionales bacterium]|nr:hypothetical protein [Bdellovibrionales bacterium]